LAKNQEYVSRKCKKAYFSTKYRISAQNRIRPRSLLIFSQLGRSLRGQSSQKMNKCVLVIRSSQRLDCNVRIMRPPLFRYIKTVAFFFLSCVSRNTPCLFWLWLERQQARSFSPLDVIWSPWSLHHSVVVVRSDDLTIVSGTILRYIIHCCFRNSYKCKVQRQYIQHFVILTVSQQTCPRAIGLHHVPIHLRPNGGYQSFPRGPNPVAATRKESSC